MVAVVFHTARLIFKHLLCDAVQFPLITEGIATFVSLHRMSKYIAAFVSIQIKPWKKRKCVYKDSVSIGNTVICYEENYLLNDYWDEKVWIDGSDEKVTMGDIGFFNSKIYVLCISKRKSSIKEERR